MVENRQLAASYALLAPFYDAFVSPALGRGRRRSLERLELRAGERVLLVGLGTGLDLPLVPADVSVTGFDLTPAMLQKARRRGRGRLFVGDAQRMPFPTASFDVVVLHLILAIVPDPARCLKESARVLAPGGRMGVFDKLLRPGQKPGLLRRAADRFLRSRVTGLNTCFEDVLAGVPDLDVLSDEEDGPRGLFRRIRLTKRPTVKVPGAPRTAS